MCKPLCDEMKTGASPVCRGGTGLPVTEAVPRHAGFSCFPMEFGSVTDGGPESLLKNDAPDIYFVPFSVRGTIKNIVFLLNGLS